MKYNSLCKSALAVVALCTAFGTIVPFSNTYIEAQETDLSTEQKNGTVGLTQEKDNYTFGNGYLKRTFSIKDGKLKTEYLTNYRTSGETKMTPASSEEFVIETMENSQEAAGFKAPEQKFTEKEKWKAKADSVATNEGTNGSAQLIFDGDASTYYHSQYANPGDKDSYEWPHNIYIDFGKKLEGINSLAYHKRLHQGNPTEAGHIKEYEVYACKTEADLKDSTKGTLVASGTFKSDNKTKVEYANFNEAVNTQYLRFVVKSSYGTKDHKYVTSIGELEFYKDKAQFPEKSASQIKSSNLTVDGDPVVGEANGYKTLTFKFKPVTARNVQYTIKEVISMKDGESFMRKHLEIEVPQEQAEQAKIKYIDLENMNFQDSDVKGNGSNQSTDTNYWTIQELQDNPHMANMKGDYLELGQPYYVGSMYWGCEFPQAENKVRDKKGFIRYHYGKNLVVENDKSDGQFHNYKNYNNANGQSGKMITWDAVVGAARSTDYQVVQSDFYEYIETIATKTGFRQQFNSWYDNMKDITDSNIQESFNEIEKGFTQYGVNPLDSYVVDDGWTNYSSFWDFDRSANKFPNELYNSSSQVNKMGSNFGLWLGPRGGYGTERQIANYIANNNLGSRNESSGNDINISDGRYLDKLVNDIFVNYQNKFDINYWKLDGMLLEPSTNSSNAHTTTDKLCTISETYERWTDMFETMRENRPDLWINMTSYTNPSPWHVQWVNSVWMQNTGDTGYSYKAGDTDEKAMLTFRDGDYYEFFTKNQWQLPNKYFYNHDPVYAKTAHNVPGGPGRQIEYTTDELREHLYMLGTRGTAFWEYYYSPSMFDNEKWQVNAEAANWIEDNFDILQKSKMFGGDPEKEQVYGYSCWNGNQGIVSIRNPKNVEQTYTLKLDEKVGVSSGVKNVYGKVVVGDQSRQTNDAVSHNTELTYTLKPKEVLIVQYGAQDGTPATIESMHADKNKVSVTFDERIQTPKAGNFTVDGNKVTDVKLDADLRTAVLTVENELEDTSDVTVKVDGVKDVVGNVSSNATFTDDYYAKDLINGIGKTTLDGNPIEKGNKYALDGTRGFTVSGEINTTQTNAEIARQDGAFTVGIDGDGYLTFNFNGMSVNSKHTEKTRQNDGSVTESVEGIIADGKKHQFAAVKEENGMIKLYMDGELVNSTYDASKVNPNVQKGNLVFGAGLTGDVEYITLHDKGLGFDEVGELKPEENVERNVISSKTNKKVKISAYDVTEEKAVSEKSDRPFSYLNDGKKDTSNYLELADTSNKTNHSRYVQVDLGDEYELNKIHLTRYYDDKRTYGPTVIELSKNEDFKEKTQVFNSDKTGTVHNLGEGKDDLYTETAEGKEIPFEKTTARYIRVYVNGQANNKSSSDHIVELEAYGVKTSVDSNKPITPDRDINLTHLNELIEQAEKKAELKEYITKDSWDLMQNALDGAKIVQNNPINQKAVDEACALLENGLKGLKADKSKLEQRLEDAKVYDGKQEFYTEDSWNTFSDALAKAETESTDVNSTPETVKKAHDRLNKAIKGLIYKDVDKTRLNELIQNAKAYDGKQEFYTEESWKSFSDALKAAKSEYKSEQSTPETVKDAQEKLDVAIQELTYKAVDKAQLQALIEAARGKNEEDYTTESWNVFAEALANAETELNSENSTPETVKVAEDKLTEAIKGLTAKKVDKSKLEALIKESEGKKEADYTPESWTTFVTELQKAKEVNSDKNAKQKTVDQTCESLRAAIEGLTAKKVDKSKLEALIQEAEGKTETDYTAKSWAKLVTALEAARFEFGNENATQESVNNACGSLRTAIDGLTVKADKTELKALIDEAANKNKDEYTSASWKALEAALKNAQSVYDTEDATQKSVQDACDSLKAAVDGLKVKVDKSQLEALIKEAEGKKEADYTTDSWKVFAEALTNAENELKSEKSTPKTVKAAEDKLSEAIKGLTTKKQVDKSQLQSLIAEATGKDEAQFTPESWTTFATALGTANEVNANKDATQEDVDQAFANLSAAMTGLTAKADKTQLQALIDEAGNKNKDEYTEESWTVFETALNEAKSVFANENASQDSVNQACESLSKAIEELKFNKSQLKVVIDQAENKNSEDYTEESWEAFANALAEARSVFEDEDATPESVDQAYRKLNDAINGLTVKVNKPELKELIDQVKDKKSEDYTDASWDAFETALEEAKAVFENEASTSEEISQAYRKLNEAINGLTVKADKTELTKVIASSVTLNESDYTPESWRQFKEVLDYADEVSANPNVSQEEVDEAKAKLEKAVKNLVKATGSEQKPTEKPDTKPEQKPTDKPEQKPTDKPGTKPEQKPADKPEEKPTDKPDTKPEQKPTDKPVQKPTEKPSKNNGTNTGTSTHVGFFATTALASATAVLGLFGYKRRNKKK
ncbi:MAG: FIVAR domain-containing protein [Holdemanella sp.]|nr:FIVAR domain-containing protein [Holdemanella sp.]